MGRLSRGCGSRGLWFEGRGSRGCGSRGLWVEGRGLWVRVRGGYEGNLKLHSLIDFIV